MPRYKLGVEVVGAHGLMPKDSQGPLSARVQLRFDGHRLCTAVRENDLNPVWNERFYFDVSDPSTLDELSLEAYVYHVEKSTEGGDGSSSFLGRVQIACSTIADLSDIVISQYYKLETRLLQKHSLIRCVNGKLGLKLYLATSDSSVKALEPPPHRLMDNVICSFSAPLLQEDQSPTPHDIPLQYLKEITNNFSDERILGQGGYGVVYKGVQQNGEAIAVKKIVSFLMSSQKQFENEVYHLMMLKHRNIVRFVGYCYETKNECLEYKGKYVFAEMVEKLICLEYMPNGSLDKYISDESSGLNWSTRYKIIEGICYGLHHLHTEIDKPIIHLDLKPSNILLDDGMVPKITDFGLSRLFGQQTICTSSRDGTFGYMAPEFLHGGTMTPKSDIFSLGVLILEVITGHRDYPDVTRTPSDDFIELTVEKWRNVLQRSRGYGSLETCCEQIKKCLQVGLLCVNPDRAKRPPITNIIGVLQESESIGCVISNEAALLVDQQYG
ncbi:cysteine-rich receptor-like protein kinase 44 [Triticum urartu]|uniref:cysteine-rich receptor-like protein kinase 44 n=1 Tax=Triticum urartu TaxID=4572 RepID=UPI0020431440|nr:cysteine-rich receptor-like protein kinase 44 [Triticum urartu]XP_048557711.1 cysteine-rich receptor-like protein kinase 44 [Triticum urartu]